MAALAKSTQVKLNIPVSVPSVAYEKVDNPKGAPYPNSDMPMYLDSSSAGKRELYRGDYRGDPKDAKAPDPAQSPLTSGGNAVHSSVYIIIDPDPGYPTGWAIYTAYPKP
jgi:hypothetical protein